MCAIRAGGLIFAAGETTFGQSGLSGSALEKVLPVEFKAQEKRKDLALVVCLDRSYSMKGRPMDLAKAGTRAALALLEEQHRFGVVAFDSQPHEAVPLQFVRSKRKAEDLIDRIQASGQTNIYPALATAWRMLQNIDTKRKHVILLSDGDTAPADFERLIKRMTDAQITVSTVTLGRAGDPELMGKIARWGKGKAYMAEDVAQVPRDLHRGHARRLPDHAHRGPLPPGRKAQDRSVARAGLCSSAATHGLRQHQSQGWRGGVPCHRVGRADSRALAVWSGTHPDVRFRRQEPLGGAVAGMAGLWPLLGTDGA